MHQLKSPTKTEASQYITWIHSVTIALNFQHSIKSLPNHFHNLKTLQNWEENNFNVVLTERVLEYENNIQNQKNNWLHLIASLYMQVVCNKTAYYWEVKEINTLLKQLTFHFKKISNGVILSDLKAAIQPIKQINTPNFRSDEGLSKYHICNRKPNLWQ